MSSQLLTVIAIMNEKGGVGKTTIASLLAEGLALLLGLRVLVIELDQQCNSSDLWYGMEEAENEIGGQLPPIDPAYSPDLNVTERSSIADIYMGKGVLARPTWLTEEVSGNGGFVDIILGHPGLLYKINTGQTNEKIKPGTLKEFLQSEELAESYDVAIGDTGPSQNILYRECLKGADYVVAPFKPERKSIQGINALMQAIRQENYSRTDDEKVKLVGLLPNLVRENTVLHADNLEKIKAQYKNMLFPEKSWITLSTAFPERDSSEARPKSVYELRNSNKSKKQVLAMFEHICKFCGIDTKQLNKKKSKPKKSTKSKTSKIKEVA